MKTAKQLQMLLEDAQEVEAHLPAGWAMARIGDLAATEPRSLTDGPFGSNLKTSHYTEAGPRVIRLQNIGDGEFVDARAHISPDHFEKLRQHEALAEDVLIAMLGENLPRACLVPESLGPAIVKADCARLRAAAPSTWPAFVMYALNAPQTRKFASALIHGVGRPRLGLGLLRELPVPLAPTSEQIRLTEAVDSYLSRLDDAVATLERVQRNLKRYRASVLKAAVEGRLVPTEAELARKERRDYEPASVVLATIEPPPRPARYNSRSRSVIPGHAALSVGPLSAPLPEGWVGTPLADVARLESGHTPSRKHPEWWGGDIRWIGIKDARAHHGGAIHETLQRTNEDGLANSAARLLPAQTVCLSRTASVGYVVVMGRPMATSQDFVNWTCTPAMDPHWLRVVLLADRDALRRFGKGTTHTTIYFPEVLSFHVALPPLAEQRRIVAEVDRLLSVADQTATAASASLRRISRLRQAILKWAFEGKLVDQDPNDEPASMLLDRIRAEREAAGASTKAKKKPGRTKRKKKSA